MLTFTGAWSRVAPGGVLSRVMVTGHRRAWSCCRCRSTSTATGRPSCAALAPLPVPVPPPPGQVATLPTVSTCPPTVEVPSGSTIDDRVARLDQVLLGHVQIDGDDRGGAGGRQHRAAPAARRSAAPAADGRADRGRDGGDPDGAGLEDHLAEQDLAGRRQAERGLPALAPRRRWPTSSGCSGSARRRSRGRSGRGSARPRRRRRTCPT